MNKLYDEHNFTKSTKIYNGFPFFCFVYLYNAINAHSVSQQRQ